MTTLNKNDNTRRAPRIEEDKGYDCSFHGESGKVAILPGQPGAPGATWLYDIIVWTLLAIFAASATTSAVANADDPKWPEALEQALSQAGTNRAELVRALTEVPPAQRDGMQFLVANMPDHDRQTLSAAFLLENVALAYDAFNAAPWRNQITQGLFHNEVLPYVCVNEKREAWRKVLYEKCAPLVADCKTPAEATQRLNQKLFGLVNVKYSTQRRRADQAPLESMSSGLASCTGLAILLVDACRSVGVPARLVGIPNWVNKRGNHTWVEIWDGRWHFTGAAEPDPNGLDRGWFTQDASQALKDTPEHAIYASSFEKTGLAFPLVWAPWIKDVSAVNVTEHYTPPTKPEETGKRRLLVKVIDHPGGQRVAAKVTVTGAADTAVKYEGTSKNESADLNDILSFELARDQAYTILAEYRERAIRRELATGTTAQALVEIYLEDRPAVTAPAQACYLPSIAKPFSSDLADALKRELTRFFTASPEQQAQWKFPDHLNDLLSTNEPATRRAAWEAYCAAPIHDLMKLDYATNQVRFDKYLSPYTVKTVGERPTNGWALFIAMHGGGGAPKNVNDSQWRVMQRYYRDHPEVGGYQYVALRAPNDTWNGFYDVYVYPLIANLIQQFLLYGGVDPNKVFIMGYSHGGYGAFAIGPKMPDRFAAIHASAAAPTDGETVPETLRNTIFTYMIGEKDTMYGRIDRCRKFNEAILKLRGERTDIYPVTMQFIAGNGHTGLPDRDKIKDMYPAVRNVTPRELTWLMTDQVIHDFFWLQVAHPGKNQQIDARCQDNQITITTTTNMTAATVLFDSRLADFAKPITLKVNGEQSVKEVRPSLLALCQTLVERGDPELAFTAKMELTLPSAANRPQAKKPVQVFILAGQSNMEGQGVADLEGKDYNEGKGTLNFLMSDPVKGPRFKHLKDDKGQWAKRDDVWVRYQLEDGPLKAGPLALGFTPYDGQHHFGPELQFGWVMGDYCKNQVLLIKTAWGGKSLYRDFRPPSSGGTVGPYYHKMLAEIRAALANLKTDFPAYDGGGYNLAGFVWYHGWNDGCEPKTAVPEYAQNLVNLIKDVRRDLHAPRLPFVIGELTGPWVEAPGEWDALRRAQAAAAARPEFAGNVIFVPTHDFVRQPEDSPNPGHGHHEFGNAETYFLVGNALGEGMKKLLTASGKDEKPEPVKPTSHAIRQLEGWTVRVDDRLLAPPNDVLGARALRFLENKLADIKAVMAAEPLAKLQAVVIVLDLSHGKLRSMQYHPSADWLRENGYSTNLVKCVHIPVAADLPTRRNINEQPWVVLHELAHAYHDQVLGFEEPRILKAYEAYKRSGHGDRALLFDGSRVRHYGLTDQKEFFAEMTEAYFGLDDFFPFNRAELMTAEPEIFQLMQTIWGPVTGASVKLTKEANGSRFKPVSQSAAP